VSGNPADDQRPPDPARRLLARARKAKPVRRTPVQQPTEAPWSGARPDARDPARLGDAVAELVSERDWTRTLNAAGILPRWAQIVGPEVAAHCRPERLEGGVLSCVAESTAWATQLRLLNRQILARIAAEVGPDIVETLKVRGPTSPDWRHGPLRVSGRGPRDTYG
jgi:predicted nucleic acid-binding Zn ribbon protein